MKGKHEILGRNARVQYKFAVERNITILRGDSATGKTTLIDMIATYQRAGEKSGVELRSDKPCVVLTAQNWQLNLGQVHESIVFIDEGDPFVRSKDFAQAVDGSDNYFVIATRAPLFNLPYSIKEIYGIRNKSGNLYQGTKRLYAEFFPLVDVKAETEAIPDLVIVEDKNAGFEFFQNYFRRYGIRCITAEGKSNIFSKLLAESYQTALVIADGAAFGPEIERILDLRQIKSLIIYLPESFEWLVLRSDVLDDHEIIDILEAPAEHIASEDYFSWERFFTAVLTQRSHGTYLEYHKNSLNKNYLQDSITDRIATKMPELHLK